MSKKKLLKAMEGKRHDAKPNYSRKAAVKQVHDDDDSFADRAIQAELDHAMGFDNDDYDWLVEPYR